MRRIAICTISIFITATFLSSCVANRKYVAEKNKAMQATADNLALNTRITRLEDTISKLHGRLGALGNANENTANELFKTSSELNLTKEQITAQRQRLQQLQSFIDQQKKASEDLKKKIADALVGFNSSELTVTLKDGRVYISMEEALLFPSGSAQVNPRGKEAVSKVAGVLNSNPDINIDIEGHTDNVPIKTKLYADNWALSTARAVSIAHVLTDEYHVSPEKLIASGRSYYHPVATNATPEGRAQNRRTEIILEPKYDELMQLMNTSTATK